MDNLKQEKNHLQHSKENSSIKMPDWLIDFDTRAPENRYDHIHIRPCTENSTVSRPLWFQELIQHQRRHSEVIFTPLQEQVSYKMSKLDVDTDFLMILDSNEGEKLDTNMKIKENKSTNRKKEIIRWNNKESDKQMMFTKKNNIRESHSAKDIKIDDIEEVNDFIIPELPKGKKLVIEIKTNWGDEDYVGLNGIEIFDLKTRDLANITKVWCEPDSTNNVEKLIDGVYRSHDDSHIWTTCWTTNPVKIHILFKEEISIALFRFWNYNKSRIYSYRGARLVVITLDNTVIFKGEIAKACGELNGPPERFGDTILFTIDEVVLETIANNDAKFQELLCSTVRN